MFLWLNFLKRFAQVKMVYTSAWNIIEQDLFQILALLLQNATTEPSTRRIIIIGYAHDVALLVKDYKPENMHSEIQYSLSLIEKWCSDKSLRITPIRLRRCFSPSKKLPHYLIECWAFLTKCAILMYRCIINSTAKITKQIRKVIAKINLS